MKKRGFTLVELLLALAILAMLLSSIAAAVRATTMSASENREISAAMQAGRFALRKICAEVRSALDIDSTSTSLTIFPSDDYAGISNIEYEIQGDSLIMTVTKDLATETETLIGSDHGVTVTTFSVVREEDLEGNVLSVTIRLCLDADGQSFSTTCSAVLRRNQLD